MSNEIENAAKIPEQLHLFWDATWVMDLACGNLSPMIRIPKEIYDAFHAFKLSFHSNYKFSIFDLDTGLKYSYSAKDYYLMRSSIELKDHRIKAVRKSNHNRG